MSEPTRRMRLFRRHPDTGERYPVIIEINNEFTILAEYTDAGPRPETLPAPDTAPRSYHRISLESLTTHWVTKEIKDNPIPGTEELRAEYLQRLEEMERRHAERGTECPLCEKGKLQRAYKHKLKQTDAFKAVATEIKK